MFNVTSYRNTLKTEALKITRYASERYAAKTLDITACKVLLPALQAALDTLNERTVATEGEVYNTAEMLEIVANEIIFAANCGADISPYIKMKAEEAFDSAEYILDSVEAA